LEGNQTCPVCRADVDEGGEEEEEGEGAEYPEFNINL
jgi:hypothetical protein